MHWFFLSLFVHRRMRIILREKDRVSEKTEEQDKDRVIEKSDGDAMWLRVSGYVAQFKVADRENDEKAYDNLANYNG